MRDITDKRVNWKPIKTYLLKASSRASTLIRNEREKKSDLRDCSTRASLAVNVKCRFRFTLNCAHMQTSRLSGALSLITLANDGTRFSLSAFYVPRAFLRAEAFVFFRRRFFDVICSSSLLIGLLCIPPVQFRARNRRESIPGAVGGPRHEAGECSAAPETRSA